MFSRESGIFRALIWSFLSRCLTILIVKNWWTSFFALSFKGGVISEGIFNLVPILKQMYKITITIFLKFAALLYNRKWIIWTHDFGFSNTMHLRKGLALKWRVKDNNNKTTKMMSYVAVHQLHSLKIVHLFEDGPNQR